MYILGIETSCDETAAAVVRGIGDKVEVLSSVVASQIEIHKKYGGVVPEVAAREHVLNILPVIHEALAPLQKGGGGGLHSTSFNSSPLIKGVRGIKLSALAVTTGPGLITSLQVGVETAKALAYAWRLPVVSINHIEGHIYANFISNTPFENTPLAKGGEGGLPFAPFNKGVCPPPYEGGVRGGLHSVPLNSSPLIKGAGGIKRQKIKFPALILTVSGGHTMLILMAGHGQYKLLGETRDDAAGEAFDKAAQLLGLGYPGGPAISQAALSAPLVKGGKGDLLSAPLIKGVRGIISLPRPMLRDKNLDFSFSGLKTALLYALKNDKNWKKRVPEYAAEFQQAVVDVLIHKTIKAAQLENCQTIMLAGGVSANAELRCQLQATVKKNLASARLIIPDLKYTTDNAAMIATAGYFRARREDFTPWQKLKTDSNLTAPF